jgi:uncharacterized membrane protein
MQMIEIIPNWHPIFVHFTVALLSVALGLFVVGQLVKCDQAVLVAKWNLWIGSAVTLITVAAGFYAYNTVAHDTPSHEAMTEHRNLALTTVALLLPVLIWSVISHRKGRSLGLAFVGLFVLQGAVLASTAWHGAELVYRHGLGVMSLPKSDDHHHDGDSDEDHDHEDGHDHDDHHDSQSMMDEEMGMEDMSIESMPHDDGHDHEH